MNFKVKNLTAGVLRLYNTDHDVDVDLAKGKSTELALTPELFQWASNLARQGVLELSDVKVVDKDRVRVNNQSYTKSELQTLTISQLQNIASYVCGELDDKLNAEALIDMILSDGEDVKTLSYEYEESVAVDVDRSLDIDPEDVIEQPTAPAAKEALEKLVEDVKVEDKKDEKATKTDKKTVEVTQGSK